MKPQVSGGWAPSVATGHAPGFHRTGSASAGGVASALENFWFTLNYTSIFSDITECKMQISVEDQLTSSAECGDFADSLLVFLLAG